VYHVVELQPSRRAAAIAAAATAIAAPHQARAARRNVLMRPLGGGAIDGSDVLGIAQGAIDCCRIDGDLQITTLARSGDMGSTCIASSFLNASSIVFHTLDLIT
jgi:hypothetical protein